MNLHLSLTPLISLLAGILILVMPKLLNFIVAIYLIVIGLIGYTPLTSVVRRAAKGRPQGRSSVGWPPQGHRMMCKGRGPSSPKAFW